MVVVNDDKRKLNDEKAEDKILKAIPENGEWKQYKDIVSEASLGPSTTSRRLSILRAKGIIEKKEDENDARIVYYARRPEHVSPITDNQKVPFSTHFAFPDKLKLFYLKSVLEQIMASIANIIRQSVDDTTERQIIDPEGREDIIFALSPDDSIKHAKQTITIDIYPEIEKLLSKCVKLKGLELDWALDYLTYQTLRNMDSVEGPIPKKPRDWSDYDEKLKNQMRRLNDYNKFVRKYEALTEDQRNRLETKLGVSIGRRS